MILFPCIDGIDLFLDLNFQGHLILLGLGNNFYCQFLKIEALDLIFLSFAFGLGGQLLDFKLCFKPLYDGL